MRFAVIADAHTGLFPGDEALERAIGEINRLDLDFVAFLGDQVDPSAGGSLPGLYQRFAAQCKKLRHPVHCVPGNHDLDRSSPDPSAHYRTFSGNQSYYGFAAGAYHFLILDTNEGAAGPTGAISPGQLAWLDRELAGLNPATPVIILMHHPPFPADAYRLAGFPDFFATIAGYHGSRRPSGRVAAVISGHRHFRETHVVDGIRFEVAGPLSFGLLDMTEIGYTLVESSAGALNLTWRALGPSPPAPGWDGSKPAGLY